VFYQRLLRRAERVDRRDRRRLALLSQGWTRIDTPRRCTSWKATTNGAEKVEQFSPTSDFCESLRREGVQAGAS
jgi:hypothetical protein